MRTLDTSSAVVAADGTTQVTLGPVPVGFTWNIALLSVRLTVGTGIASVYTGLLAIDAAYLDGTYDGARDTTSRIGQLAQGEQLLVTWTGATPTATATATLRGDATNAPR